MRIAIKTVQVIVGLLFIVSGLVKANDPVGLGYKMQEFFELWSEGFANASVVSQSLAAMHKAALGLSIFMITLEIVAGVALLLAWKKKFILWLLLLLILFLTFLTGYAYLSGKFTNCGCFGDCLPITPFTSFVKDLVLTAFILFLLAGQRFLTPVFSRPVQLALLGLSLFIALLLQWYVLNYLPLADCLPFQQASHLPTQMKPPPGAVPDSFAIRFVYEKGGKQYEFAPENLPADFTTYKFIDRKQSLVRKGNAEAAIRGFALTNDTKDSTTGNTVDYTNAVLSQPNIVLVFALDFSNLSWITKAKSLVANAAQKRVPVAVISPNYAEAQAAFTSSGISGVQFYNTDFTIVRTVARTNPTVLYLQKGTVMKKWSRNELNKAADWLLTQP